MNTYKEFKQAYKKYFLEHTDYPAFEMVSCTEDIPTDDMSYKNAVIRAYLFLSNCKSRDIGHLKILTNYDKLMKRNQEAGKNVTPVVFATMLYIFHQYCVRILRSPWRTDFSTIKIYNGFYQYTLQKALAPSVIEDMMAYIGFKLNALDNVFVFTLQSLDHACVRTITDAGIGFFLSYTHCMAKNDSQFKKTVPALMHLLQSPLQDEPPASLPPTVRNSDADRPSTSGLAEQERRAQNEGYSNSAARERRRDRRNIYGNDRNPQSTALVSQTMNMDIYGSQENPVDLSTRPYGHRVKRISEDWQSNSSSHGSPNSGSIDLYGGSGELKPASAEYFSTRTREMSPENLPPEHVRNSLTMSHRGHPTTLDSQMEKFSVNDRSRNSATREQQVFGKPLLDPTKRYPQSHGGDANYVKLYPTANTAARGSPDGEIAAEPHFDYASTSQQSRTSTYRDSKRQPSSTPHVYHKIN